MSLRTRVIAAVALIALALTVVLVYVARTTEANLVDQADEQLLDAVQPVRGLDLGDRLGRRPRSRSRSRPVLSERTPRQPELSSLYVAIVDGDEVTPVVRPGLRSEDLPLPDVEATEATARASGAPFTVGSIDGDLRWRVHAYGGADGDSVRLIALPLDTVDESLADLVALELLAAGVIAVCLALVAFWAIRLGIRPVRKMTEVATAIAGGDLTHRVPDTDPTTEAGQLGDALNRMLASIEASFAERQGADDRLRQFVADASHELRTPVATIRGYAELYRVGGLEGDGRLDDAMRRTEQESIRMGGLVEDLLGLARLDEGRPLDLAPVDLAAVARDAAADALAVEPRRTVTTSTTGPLLVDADEAKVRQVVANLVANARVHTPPDASIAITTGTTRGRHFLEVADDGPGMAPDVAARAFERFYRADPSRSRHQGGSGLGLSIVDAVVRAHRGEVTLRSTPGAGTVVRVELPRAD